MFADIRYAFCTFGRQRSFYSLVIFYPGVRDRIERVALFSLADGILIRPLRYHDPLHPISFFVAALSLWIAALLASSLPARAAAQIDPTNALRQE